MTNLAETAVEAARTSPARNGLWNGLATLVAALTGLVGSVLIIRSLSTETYGAFSYYMWLAGIFGTAGTLAFPEAITKITSELRGEQHDGEAQALSRWVTISLVGLNLVLSLSLLTIALASSPPQQSFLIVVAIFLAPGALMSVVRSTLWGQGRFRRVAVTSVIASLVQLALIVVATRSNWGAPAIIAAVMSTNIVQAIGLGMALQPVDFGVGIPISLSFPSLGTLRRYLAFVLPATLGIPLTTIIWERSEVFFLARYRTLEEIGFYNLAYTMFSLTLALGWALIHGFYPAMSQDYGAGDWTQIQRKVRQGLLIATLFTIPISFGGWATIEGFISLFYGDKMLPAAPIARILLIGLFPGVVGAMIGSVLTVTGRIWIAFRLGVLICLMNIGLDLMLIPHSGAFGGAVANTASQVAYAALTVVFVRRLYKITLPWRAISSIVALGAGTTLALPSSLEVLLPGPLGLVGAVILSGALYLAAMQLFGYVRTFRSAEAIS